MRSDTPKVLHTLAGRSMLAHALHAVAKVAPQHLVVVVGTDRDRVVAAVDELADDLGRTHRHRRPGRAAGHRPRRRLRAGRAARRLRRHRVVTAGDVPLLDADTLADLSTRTAPSRRGDGADHDAARPDRLRPRPAHPGRRGDRHRRAGRRHAVAAGDPRGQRRRLRVRRRRAALGAEPAALRQRPAASST